MTTKTMTEQELRETTVNTPQTIEELATQITGLVEREHDYGTCVYAMSMAAVAAYQYVASKLDVTGFQASCADLDFIRRVRCIEGPFILLKMGDALYPQYDLPGKLREWLDKDESREWMKEQSKKLIAGADGLVHPNVMAHWVKLAGEETK